MDAANKRYFSEKISRFALAGGFFFFFLFTSICVAPMYNFDDLVDLTGLINTVKFEVR